MRQARVQLPTLRLTTLKQIKRVVIAVVGGTVLAIGIALIVLPGPAFLVIPGGLPAFRTGSQPRPSLP